jgi:hypothetical protein
VWRLRRGLERLSTGGRREPSPYVAVSAYVLTRELEELIAALDRRAPRIEQAGEATIARDAAALRAKAVDRLAALADESVVPLAEASKPSTRRPMGCWYSNRGANDSGRPARIPQIAVSTARGSSSGTQPALSG